MKLYCAYGSNLCREQMRKRCPESRFVGVGKLFGYELCFRGAPNGAYATVIEKEGAFVSVAVYMITEKDEQSLDRFEGHSHQYDKIEVEVEMGDTVVSAMTYIMPPNRRAGLPGGSYYARIWDGYHDCGFDPQLLQKALQKTFEQFYKEALEAPRGTWTFFL